MSERIELSPAGMRQKMEDAISRAVCSNIDDSTFRNRWVCNHSLCPLTNADWRSRALTVARSRWLLASSLRGFLASRCLGFLVFGFLFCGVSV